MEKKKEKIISNFDIVQRTLQRIAKSETQIHQDSLSMLPFRSAVVASLEKRQNRLR